MFNNCYDIVNSFCIGEHKVKTIIDVLLDELKKEQYFLDDSGEVIKSKLVDSAIRLDSVLLNVLVSNNLLKKTFFTEVNTQLIFDSRKFSWFLSNTEILPSSYTAFKNRIGLVNSENDFIKGKNDVFLSFPYKDCVLEFDSTKENEDRKEIFLNEKLMASQIDILFSQKALGNAKRVTKEGIKSDIEFNEDNLIISGNNLIGMYSLLSRYEGQIKLMYWDILYNTSSDNVPYNDSFKHSSWLTMMKNRLEVGRRLLKDEGSIVLQCDDNEQAYLKVLCDEVFGRDNLVNVICVKMSELKGFKMGNLGNKFPKLKEYLLIYGKDRTKLKLKIESVTKDNLDQYTKYYNKRIVNIGEPCEDWKIETVDKNYDKIKHANEMIYIVTRDTKVKEDLPIKKFVKTTNKNGDESFLIFDGKKINTVLFLSDYIKEPIGDIWMDISTININKESSVQLANGKKPENLLKRIISSLSEEGDIVLDAYFGTGTTGAVAMKMKRRFIGIEQLDSHFEKCIQRLKEVVEGDNSGISQEVNWLGGDSFVFCEMLKDNQKVVEDITKIKTKEEATAKLSEILNNPLILNYSINPNLFGNELTNEFLKLELNEMKLILMQLIEKNTLYTSYSDILDENKKISETDRMFSKSFYDLEG